MKQYYEPAEDSLLLLEQVKRYAKGMVLDMGTGSGILAIEAARRKGTVTSVLAADINPAALKAARRNAATQKLKSVTFRKTDLFSNIHGKFDTIIFNPPYLPQDEGVKDIAIYGGKQGHEVIARFLTAADTHLNEEGIILLLFSSLTTKAAVDSLLKESLLEPDLISSQHLFFEELYVYLIRKSPLLKKLNKKATGLSLLAKGHRGLVYTARYKGRKVAIKTKHPDSTAPARIHIEALFLKELNKKWIGPRLFEAEEEYLIMEYIEGKQILDYLSSSPKKKILGLLKETFLQLYELDRLGINKDEMHHPVKHIIVRKDKPVLIDFERAKHTEKPHNVTQFCQFITGNYVLEILNKKKIAISKQEMTSAARAYSQDNSEKSLGDILSLLV